MPMDVLLALLALFNVISPCSPSSCRARFPDNALPWFVFAFALLATELAWLWLPLQIMLALLFVAGGALGSTLGWIALVVLLLSWPGCCTVCGSVSAAGVSSRRRWRTRSAPIIRGRFPLQPRPACAAGSASMTGATRSR
jgi:hypothetical protein